MRTYVQVDRLLRDQVSGPGNDCVDAIAERDGLSRHSHVNTTHFVHSHHLPSLSSGYVSRSYTIAVLAPPMDAQMPESGRASTTTSVQRYPRSTTMLIILQNVVERLCVLQRVAVWLLCPSRGRSRLASLLAYSGGTPSPAHITTTKSPHRENPASIHTASPSRLKSLVFLLPGPREVFLRRPVNKTSTLPASRTPPCFIPLAQRALVQ